MLCLKLSMKVTTKSLILSNNIIIQLESIIISENVFLLLKDKISIMYLKNII